MTRTHQAVALILCSILAAQTQGNTFTRVRYNGGTVPSKVSPHDWDTPAKCTVGMKNSPSKAAAEEQAEDLARKWPKLLPSKQRELVRELLRRVTVGETTVWIEVDKTRLLSILLGLTSEAFRSRCAHKLGFLKLIGNFQVLRRGGQIRVIAPDDGSGPEEIPVQSLLKAAARARDWYEQIVAGKIHTIGQLGQESGLTRTYIMRILSCARLSPQIIEAVLAGKHHPNLSLKRILERVPLHWRAQEKEFLPYLAGAPQHPRRQLDAMVEANAAASST